MQNATPTPSAPRQVFNTYNKLAALINCYNLYRLGHQRAEAVFYAIEALDDSLDRTQWNIFAAAPDLLIACKNLLAAYDRERQRLPVGASSQADAAAAVELKRAARAAIAKAQRLPRSGAQPTHDRDSGADEAYPPRAKPVPYSFQKGDRCMTDSETT